MGAREVRERECGSGRRVGGSARGEQTVAEKRLGTQFFKITLSDIINPLRNHYLTNYYIALRGSQTQRIQDSKPGLLCSSPVCKNIDKK